MICAEAGGHIVIPSQHIDHVAPSHSDLVSFKERIHTLELPVHRDDRKLSIWSKKFGDQVVEAEKNIKKFILENNWELAVYSYPDGDGGLDVVPPSIDKVNLLNYIPDNSTIYYMGDDHNDLRLLNHERTIPCTVANAKEAVKETVRRKQGYVATKAVGEGVSEMISQLFSV
jgi:hydroxymethylpyrimidine pyrophosphatase-like HAD family hydrolase